MSFSTGALTGELRHRYSEVSLRALAGPAPYLLQIRQLLLQLSLLRLPFGQRGLGLLQLHLQPRDPPCRESETGGGVVTHRKGRSHRA